MKMLNSKLLFSLLFALIGGTFANEIIAQEHRGDVSRTLYINTFDGIQKGQNGVQNRPDTKVLKNEEVSELNMSTFLAEKMQKDGRFYIQGYAKSAGLVERFSFDSRDFDGTVENFCSEIISQEAEAFLGVSNIGTEDFNGVIIESVIEGTSAQVIGVESGDVLISVNGNEVNSPCELTSIIHDLDPGNVVNLHIVRNDAELDLNGNIGGRTTRQVSWIPCTEEAATITTNEISPERMLDDEDDLGNTPIEAIDLSIYPNPSQGIFSIEYTSQSTSSVFITIQTNYGRVVFEDSVKEFQGLYTRQMDMTRFGAGIYYLIVEQDGLVSRDKIVLQY